MSDPRSLLRGVLAVACLLAAAGSVVARQNTPAPISAPPPAAATPPAAAPQAPATPMRIDAEAMKGVMARWLTRIAIIDLKLSLRPGVNEYGCSATLLDDARVFAPNDADILRLLIEARVQLGENDQANALMRELRKLDPQDRVVELNLLSGLVASKQTVDERLRLYDTLLGPKGIDIDPTVRSRLALDSALLLREKADAAGFADRLRLALSLDPTNKDAAGLFVSVVNAQTEDTKQRFTALLILLLSDPIDPEIYLAVARELAAGGASRGAIRFYDNVLELVFRTDNQRPSILVAERLVELWKSESPKAVYTSITEQLLPLRKEAAAAIAKAKSKGLPTDRIQPPEEIRLPLDLERLWAISAHADGNEQETIAGLDELEKSVEIYEQRINSADKPEGLDEQALKKALVRRQADLLWMRLLTGKQIEQASRQIAALRINPLLGNEALARLEGWHDLRTGKAADGEDRLRRLSDAGDDLATLGLAVARELKGDTAGAAADFTVLSQQLSGTLAGSWAFSRASTLGGKRVASTPLAKDLENAAAGVPGWVDQMARDPRNFMALTVKPTKDVYGPLEKAELDIVVRNSAPIALAVGNDRPINSRLLVSTDTQSGTKDQRIAPPEVVSLDRRFAVPRGETSTIRIWPEPSLAGWIGEMSAGSLGRVRWRVLQGFRIISGISPEVGPLSLSAESPIIIRQRVPGAADPPPEMIASLQRASIEELPFVLLALKHRLYRDETEAEILTPEARLSLSAALTDRYTKADQAERMVILTCMPSGRFLKGLLDFDAAILRLKETDSALLRLKIITRAVDKDDPLLVEGDASPDPVTRAVAAMMRQRLVDNPKTFSRLPSTGRWSVTGQ